MGKVQLLLLFFFPLYSCQPRTVKATKCVFSTIQNYIKRIVESTV